MRCAAWPLWPWNRKNFDQALDYQARLIEKGERSPGAVLQHRSAASEIWSVGRRRAAVREALNERAQFPEALLNLGHVLKSLGKQDEARDCWKRALEQKPELAESYFGKAN